MEGGEAVREDVVSTAVRFLQNDKVAYSSEETKRNFLSKKGLTEDEIQTAFKQVGSPAVPPAPPVLYQQQLLQQQLLHQQSGFSSRLRDLLNILLLIGGVSYGVRYLWKKYVQPWLYGITQPSKSPQETLMETCNAILTSVELLKKSMTSLESSLDRHSYKLDQVSQNMETSSVDGSSMKDIKSEVQSVKGILLSSRSFPQNPSVTPPRIPSWQLEDGPDLLAKTGEVGEEEAMKDETSGNGSSISEIEMINSDSNGEETQ